jgi:TonB-linked SusC/RagA family outer membrane protein
MRKLLLQLALAMLLWVPGSQAFAQTNTITGAIVSDDDGTPLAEVTVTNNRTGKKALTSTAGSFSIEARKGDVLEFNYVGYEKNTFAVGDGNTASIRLTRAQTQLDDVVVTALGIKKEKKALGYAVQDIKGDELMKNKSPNLINSLNGKIAGVNITNSSGAPGASAQIVIRGGTSVLETSDNQPLFVIDGIPIDNSTPVGNTSYDRMGAAVAGFSNRAMDINPDDIESISVLKGPSAAALYGLRAAAGAIVITTKKGKDGTTQVSFSSRATMNKVAKLPEQQDQFKQGNTLTTSPTYLSWGPAFTASDTVFNNLEDFFQTGWGIDNNINVSGGSKNGSYFLSAQRLDQTGTVPTTNYKKTALRYNGEQKLGWFTFGANASFVRSTSVRALTGGGLFNTSGMGYMQGAVNWPRNNNMAFYEYPDGSKRRLLPGVDLGDDVENPYWLVNHNPISDKTNRFTGAAYTRIKPVSWLEFSYKVGLDYYVTKINNLTSPGSAVLGELQKGGLTQTDREVSLLSSIFLINIQKNITRDFDLNLLLGQTTEWNDNVTDWRIATGFLIPSFPGINNAAQANKTYQQSIGKRRLVGAYGDLRLSYRNIAYVDVTGRNDWSSTLPEKNRSFFYPSVSGSFVFSELLHLKALSFGKLRASWSQVGKDAPIYQTGTSLDVPQTSLGGGYRDGFTGGNPDLKPETTTSTEIGTELRFLKNRIGLELTLYRNLSKDQIVSPRVSQGLGYIFRYVNSGKIENKGIEITLNATPVKQKYFEWSTNVNISHNDGRVLELPGSIPILYVTESQFGYTKAASYNNGVFLGMSGRVWQRVKDGQYKDQLILNPTTGLPITGTDETNFLGDREPTLLIGWNNNFSYKNWGVNFLLDGRLGGDVYNGTEFEMINSGLSKRTEDRGGKYTFAGVTNTGTADKPVYTPFSKEITLNQDYYVNYYNYNSPNFIQKVNWLRLRSVSLSYRLPQQLLANQFKFVKNLELVLSAQNLFLITNYKGMDPEVSAGGAGVGGSGSSGMDYLGVPPNRSYTFGINVKF